MRKQIAKNVSWLFVAEVGSRLGRGILAIIAARWLGADGFGQFTYALALGGILTFFEDAGIGMFITRELSKQEKNSFLKTAFSIKGVLLGIGILLIIFLGPHLVSIPGARELLPLVAIIIASDSLLGLWVSIIRAEQQMHKESIVKIISSSTIVILGIILMLITPSALSLAYGYAIGGLLGVGIGWWFVRNSIPQKIFGWSSAIVKKIFTTSWPYVIITVSSMLILNTDTLFLGHFSSDTEVGFYGAANRLMQLLYIFPHLINAAIFPSLVQKIHNGNPFKKAFVNSFFVLLSLALLAVIGVLITAQWIVPLLFGSDYIPTVTILMILGISTIPLFVGQLFQYTIFALDIQKKFIIIHVFGFVLNIILNLLFIPKLLGVGAALATVISLGAITLFSGIHLLCITRGYYPIKK